MNSMKEILVTGGAGYIGSHTVISLIEQGFSPVIVDNFSNSSNSVVTGIKKITGIDPIVYENDVCDESEMRKIFQNHRFDGIIHFAAFKAVGESVEEPLKYYRNNLDGLMTCLSLAEEFEVEHFIFSSSCTVYGDTDRINIVTEETPLNAPLSPYGATKAFGERIIQDFIQVPNTKLRAVCLRYFNPVGAHPSGEIGELPLGRPNNLLPFLTQTGAGKFEKLIVNGNDYKTPDGTCIRDYVHVMDVADAHVKSLNWLTTTETELEVINVGTGKGTSVLEIIHTFENVSGQSLKWEFGPRRPGDIQEIYADVSKANKLLNWKAKRTVADAVLDAWNWEQKLKND